MSRSLRTFIPRSVVRLPLSVAVIMVVYRYDEWSDWICTENEYMDYYTAQGWWGRPRAKGRLKHSLLAYFVQLPIVEGPGPLKEPNPKLNPSSHWRNYKVCHNRIAKNTYKAMVSD